MSRTVYPAHARLFRPGSIPLGVSKTGAKPHSDKHLTLPRVTCWDQRSLENPSDEATPRSGSNWQRFGTPTPLSNAKTGISLRPLSGEMTGSSFGREFDHLRTMLIRETRYTVVLPGERAKCPSTFRFDRVPADRPSRVDDSLSGTEGCSPALDSGRFAAGYG